MGLTSPSSGFGRAFMMAAAITSMRGSSRGSAGCGGMSEMVMGCLTTPGITLRCRIQVYVYATMSCDSETGVYHVVSGLDFVNATLSSSSRPCCDSRWFGPDPCGSAAQDRSALCVRHADTHRPCGSRRHGRRGAVVQRGIYGETHAHERDRYRRGDSLSGSIPLRNFVCYEMRLKVRSWPVPPSEPISHFRAHNPAIFDAIPRGACVCVIKFLKRSSLENIIVIFRIPSKPKPGDRAGS